jgi:cyclopropane fatty-acyl-phospholipid synthase-like methyltransferase
MKTTGKNDAFVKFGEMAANYGQQYAEADFEKFYPEHKFRLKIFLDLLKTIKPTKLLDVGCGSGEPLVAMLGQGYDAYGFDYSKEMVAQTGSTLSANGHDSGRVSWNNMEDIQSIARGDYDCIVALGSLYYSRDLDRTMKNITSLLPKGGQMIFSLRNDLFSLFSLNKYSADFFLNKLMPTAAMSDSLKKEACDLLETRFAEKELSRKFQTVDDRGIHSTYHNPLTVEKELLKPCGLRLEGIYYYHYHALPPIFEHTNTVEFRRLSAQLEDPTDWRGMFMSSSFVVHASRLE